MRLLALRLPWCVHLQHSEMLLSASNETLKEECSSTAALTGPLAVGTCVTGTTSAQKEARK